jgi:phosphomannomutase
MRTLILFDVDGTLTIPRKKIEQPMEQCLRELSLKEDIEIGFVGGSDLEKQIEQLTEENFKYFTWMFSQNGLKSFYKQELFYEKSLIEFLGEKKYNFIINKILFCLSELEIPKKRGNFIELRSGLINVSPIGRSCNQIEREEFNELDKKHKFRETLIKNIKIQLGDIADEFNYSIGGQISFDMFPKGWDKTFALQFVENSYKKIYFFGDMVHEGGNDYEIFHDKRVHGFKVNNYTETIYIINDIFLQK